MRKAVLFSLCATVALIAAFLLFTKEPEFSVEDVLKAFERGVECTELKVEYPLDGTIFPPESIPPILSWKDDQEESNTWVVSFRFQSGEQREFASTQRSWTPPGTDWEAIKQHSREKDCRITILGVRREDPRRINSAASFSIRTSSVEVGAPIFYREVNLPFREAVKDPTRIRWRMGTIDSPERPPVVLDNLPVCGNCHSFSSDGDVLGMDVDYANDKGSYAIAPVSSEITLGKDRIITWGDYAREDKTQTFGLLSQVSPDGRYVISTVKDRSVFVAKDDLAYSQLFFPVKGILAVHDRETGTFQSLPGANDPAFVQSNPVWSPDGKYIVFARSKAYDLKIDQDTKRALLTEEECREFLKDEKTFLFDLYRVPFNRGKGGTAEPLEGASQNGKSNFFAKYSPDGKWIVFCQARSYMLLQPDSKLFIIPADGGKARRMRCNTQGMNSWHSWSPNGRWLVFASKARGPFTQLFLAHVDEEGRSAPAVVLSQFTGKDRAANIPEFLRNEKNAIKSIKEAFVDDISYIRAALEYLRADEHDNAERMLLKALELNPKNLEVRHRLGMLHIAAGSFGKALVHLRNAIRVDPHHAKAYFILGNAFRLRGDFASAAKFLTGGLQIEPDNVAARSHLGLLLIQLGKREEAEAHLMRVADQEPDDPSTRYNLGLLLLQKGKLADSEKQMDVCISLQAEGKKGKVFDALPVFEDDVQGGRKPEEADAVPLALRTADLLFVLAERFDEARKARDAVRVGEKALKAARAAKDGRLAQQIEKKLVLFRRRAGER